MCKDVPTWTISSALMANVSGFYLHSRYVLFFNSYVQENGTIRGLEIFCSEKGPINLRVY